MQRLEVSGAVRPIYGSLGVKGLNTECLMVQRQRKSIALSSNTSNTDPHIGTERCGNVFVLDV